MFSPPVHCLRTREFLTQGYTEGSIPNIENSLFPYDNILPFMRFAERESIAGNSAGSQTGSHDAVGRRAEENSCEVRHRYKHR